MFDRLEDTEKKYEDLTLKIGDPDIIADNGLWRGLMKEHSELEPIVEKYREYKGAKEAIAEAKELLSDKTDEDFRELVKEELAENTRRLGVISDELKLLLLPKDPNDEKNVIVEIRGGAGGDEANIFAGDLFRMYSKYSEQKGFSIDIMNTSYGDVGGFKEITFMVKGKGAYSRLKFESGVHRVQRVPETESGGRIHTSTVTVAVLPEAEEVDVKLDPKDYHFDVFRASGNGGQCVNTTDSAVRLTHHPTGIVISCQDEKSQRMNKEKALKILMSKLYRLEEEKKQSEIAEERHRQVGSGMRNEKIRTYNYPQNRVTDHRIGLTIHRLDSIINGDLDEIIDNLTTADRSEKLSLETEA
ncbi:MAG: peptide chain release factor 1 [Clostridiales bacterium]|nr:peptide chain release factor 1 [Clostridiales bacterium]